MVPKAPDIHFVEVLKYHLCHSVCMVVASKMVGTCRETERVCCKRSIRLHISGAVALPRFQAQVTVSSIRSVNEPLDVVADRPFSPSKFYNA